VVNRISDPDGVLAKATEVIRADYELPFLARDVEPQNCPPIRGGVMELWSPTQFPTGRTARSRST
jgi:hypothetical protein